MVAQLGYFVDAEGNFVNFESWDHSEEAGEVLAGRRRTRPGLLSHSSAVPRAGEESCSWFWEAMAYLGGPGSTGRASETLNWIAAGSWAAGADLPQSRCS